MQAQRATRTSTAPDRTAAAMSGAAPQVAAPGDRSRPLPPPSDALTAVLARAVARRAAQGGPLLQRMTLEQTGWLPDVEDIGERTLVTDGRKVRLYFKQAPEAPNKAAALASAAQLNAAVGKASDDRAYAAWSVEKGWPSRLEWRSNDKWTPSTATLGDAGLKSLDPFFFGVKVPFKVGDASHVLELSYQHATNWTGYVENVYDSSNPATSAVPSMYDLDSEAPLKGTRPEGEHWRNLLYSNKHDVDMGTNLLTTSGGGTDASFDAYTKIAGEGARWQCVRAHGHALQDDTMFYVEHTDATKRGVSFRMLWLNWRDVFGKAYDVPDTEVAAAITTAMTKRRGTKAARGCFARGDVKVVASPAPKDYDLDTGLPGA